MNFSNLITDAMKYIDDKLKTVNPNSANRQRVRSMANAIITSKVKELILLNPSSRQKAIDSIFRSCLLKELGITRRWKNWKK